MSGQESQPGIVNNIMGTAVVIPKQIFNAIQTSTQIVVHNVQQAPYTHVFVALIIIYICYLMFRCKKSYMEGAMPQNLLYTGASGLDPVYGSCMSNREMNGCGAADPFTVLRHSKPVGAVGKMVDRVMGTSYFEDPGNVRNLIERSNFKGSSPFLNTREPDYPMGMSAEDASLYRNDLMDSGPPGNGVLAMIEEVDSGIDQQMLQAQKIGTATSIAVTSSLQNLGAGPRDISTITATVKVAAVSASTQAGLSGEDSQTVYNNALTAVMASAGTGAPAMAVASSAGAAAKASYFTNKRGYFSGEDQLAMIGQGKM